MLVSSLHYESTESIQINIAIPLSTQYYCTAGYNHFLSLLAYVYSFYVYPCIQGLGSVPKVGAI